MAEGQWFADLPDILTVEESARFLRISRSAAYEGVRTGEIPSISVGRRRLIAKAALVEKFRPVTEQK